jgi:hypothetical protein
MSEYVRVPYPALDGFDVWTEPIQKYYLTHTIPDSVLDDGASVMSLWDRLRDRLLADVRRRHLVVLGEALHQEVEYDPESRSTNLVLWVQVYRDPVWLSSILAEARAAVDDDQRWLAGVGRH